MSLAKRAPRRREPLYLRLLPMVDPRTGEERKAFVAADDREAAVLKSRKLSVGDVYRCELHKPRNPAHHRLVMATMQFMVENVDGIDTIDQALMLVKIGMGYCDPVIDGTTGRTLYIVRSISFDAMGEDEFSTFHRDLVRFITKRYLGGMDEATQAQFADLVAGTEG